jgi:hypothetical protein
MDKNHLASKKLFLVISICAAFPAFGDVRVVSNAARPVAQSSCSAEDLRGRPSARIKNIVGMYQHSVNGLPAYAYPSDESRTGYNYLAIIALGGNQLRVRLTTKEINGHDCGFDSRALLCGRTIRLLPNEEERSTLKITKQSTPSLLVTKNFIAFTSAADGTVVSGSPYCGNRGSLNQKFNRISRNSQIDNSVFNQ